MMSKTCRTNLLILAGTYAKANRMSLSQVSTRAYGSAYFLQKFKEGKVSISLAKLDEMIAWFRENWPPNADWPMLRAIFMDRN